MVTYDSIDWGTFKKLDREESFLEYSNHTIKTIRQLPKIRSVDLQVRYCNVMTEKQNNFLFVPNKSRNEILTIERRKRGSDNSWQFDRITKASHYRSYSMVLLILNKVLLKRSTLTFGTKNNCFKSYIPTLTFFYVTNIRQIQKNTEKDILKYVEMKVLAQVNRIKDGSESETEKAKNRIPTVIFATVLFPYMKGQSSLG